VIEVRAENMIQAAVRVEPRKDATMSTKMPLLSEYIA
jgi:hypothetical protein